ncbi:hypothetical protein HaLaN_13820, partial [Haematococcus lacustris]
MALAPRWLGTAGHPQDIAQCRRALGALRIGAAASPRGEVHATVATIPAPAQVTRRTCDDAGVSEYTMAHLNGYSKLQLRLR